MKKINALASAVLLTVLLTCSAHATVYYVDASRPDDSGDGTSWATAKKTIQAAVDQTEDGDAVTAADGRYEISAEISVTNAIMLQSVNGADMTITDATYASRCMNLGNVECVINGFTFTKGYSSTSGGGVYCIDTNPIIKSCIFSANRTGWDGGGLYFGTAQHCTFDNNSAPWGAGQRYGSAYDCTYLDNAASQGGGGLADATASCCTFRNNTAVGDGGAALKCTLENGLVFDNTAARGAGLNAGEAFNCTFSSNDSTNDHGTVRFSSANNSIAWPDALTADTTAQACFTNNPYFAGADHADYRLSATSTCLNAGNNSLVISSADKDGESRIAFSIVDPGAYEWQGTLSTDHAPASGGSMITIHFDNPEQNITNVTLCGSTAVILSQNQQQIVVQTGPSPDPTQSVTGAILLQTDTGTTTLPDAFTYEIMGSISNTSPDSGSTEGGTSVTLSGHNLSADPADVQQVVICDQDAIISSVSPTQILAVTSANMNPGTGNIKVVSSRYGTIVASNAFLAVSPQSITATTPTNSAVFAVGTSVVCSATASSGLSVSITNLSGGATIHWQSENTFVPLSTGTLSLVFSQAGNSSYAAAPSLTNTLTIDTAGTIYYVSTNGDDYASGLSWATAKRTLQGAASCAGPYSTILVSNGTYSSGASVVTDQSRSNRVVLGEHVTMRSVNGYSQTAIWGDSIMRCAYLKSHAKLEGFTIAGGRLTDNGTDFRDRAGAGCYLESYAEVRNCFIYLNIISNEKGSDCWGGGAYLDEYASISSCNILWNRALSTSKGFGGGLYMQKGSATNCFIEGNRANYRGSGVYMDLDCSLINCSVVSNSEAECGVFLYTSGTIANSIVWGHSMDLDHSTLGSYSINNTCAGNLVKQGINNCITNDPLMADIITAELQADSPCINAGNNLYVSESCDLNGVPRIMEDTVDMGAAEYYSWAIKGMDDSFLMSRAHASLAQGTDFGTCDYGIPVTNTLTITNTTDTVIPIDVTLSGTNPDAFALPGSYPISVPASNVVQIPMVFPALRTGTNEAQAIFTGPQFSPVVVKLAASAKSQSAFGPVAPAYFTATYGDTNNPAATSLTLTNTGESAIHWMIETDYAPGTTDWLQFSDTNGTLSSHQSTEPSLSVELNGLSAGTYTATNRITSPSAATVEQVVTLTIAQKLATLTFTNLNQVYDGTPKYATAQTMPSNLNVEITYNGTPELPLNAGTYAVTGTIITTSYCATQTAEMVISPADQTITFNEQGAVNALQGLDLTATASSSLPISYRIVEFSPSNANNYCWMTNGTHVAFVLDTEGTEMKIAVSQSGNSNWHAAPTITNDFLVYSQVETVTVENLTVTYDGQPHAPTWSCTNAAVTNVVLYYNELENSDTNTPVQAGTYDVMAIIDQTDIRGGGLGSLTIERATQTVTNFNLPTATLTTNRLQLAAQTDRGFTNFTFTCTEGPGVIAGSQLTFTNSGTAVIQASQAGTTNYLPTSTAQSVVVSRAVAALTLSNLNQSCDGTPKGVTAHTDPSGLSVTFTYNSSTNVPINAGSYAVTGTVADALYQAERTDTFIISKGPQTLSETVPADAATYTAGTSITCSATSSSGLPLTITNVNSDAPVAWIANNRFTAYATGTVQLVFAQSGNSNYLPAAVTNTVTFTPASNTLYVTTNGSDTASGLSWDTAKATIQAAVNNATTGTLIQVGDGVFKLSNPINISQNGLTLRSANGASHTTIDGQLQVQCFNLTNTTAIIQGFTITDGVAENGAGVYGHNQNATVLDCIFHSNRAEQYGGGAYGVKVINSVFYSNTAVNGSALVAASAYNCTISDSDEPTAPPAIYGSTLYNSICWPGSILHSKLNHSCTNDPSYADASIQNYRLYAASPCINAGDNTYVWQTTDLDGHPRIMMDTVDIGAYERSWTWQGDTDFGAVNYNTASNRPITLSNGMSSNLQIVVSADNSSFSLQAASPVNIPANSSLTLTVAFNELTQSGDYQTAFTLSNLFANSDYPIEQPSYSAHRNTQAKFGNIPSADLTGTYKGNNPSTPSIPLANHGESPCTWQVTTHYSADASGWQTIAATTGALSGESLTNIPVSIDIQSLDVGTYTAQNVFTTTDAAAPVTQLVTLVIARAPAALSFSDLIQSYDGSSKCPGTQTDPSDLSVSLTYDGSTNQPLNAGSYAVTGIIDSPSYYGTNTASFTISKADQTVAFTQQGPVDASKGLDLSATASSDLPVSFYIASMSPSNDSNRAWISNNHLSLTVEAAEVELKIAAAQTGNTNWNAAVTVTNTFAAFVTYEEVTVTSASVTYDGQPHAVTWSCANPAVTNVILYYNGLAPAATNPPVDAAEYEVSAIINQSGIYGGGSGTLTINPRSQQVTVFNLPTSTLTTNILALEAQTDQGFSNFTFSVVSGPARLSDNLLFFTNSGTATLQATQPGTDNILPITIKQSVTISKTPADALSLTNLNQTYDGTPKKPTSITSPTGLTTRCTYNGTTNSPVNAGDYAVEAIIDDSMYSGSTTGLFYLAKASPALILAAPGNQLIISNPVLSATSSCPLDITYSVLEGPAQLNDATLSFTNTGNVTVGAIQAGDTNWLSATSTVSFTVSKAPATISLSNLSPSYNGASQQPTVQTTPADLPVTLTFNGSTSCPVNVGTYAVTGRVNTTSYTALTTNTFNITKANQSIYFPQQGAISASERLDLTALASSGLPVAYSIASMSPSNANNRAWITNDSQLIFAITADSVELQLAADQSGDANWNAAGTVTNTFTAYQQHIDVAIHSEPFIYNGQPHAATWSCTNAAVTNVTLYYDGRTSAHTNPPVDAATHEVVALIDQPNLYGGGYGTLLIAQRPQTITSFNLPATAVTTNTIGLQAETDAGFTDFSFTLLDGPGQLQGNQLSFTNAGTASILAAQAGNSNYLSIAVTQSISITKAASTLTLAQLTQTYDGTPKTPVVQTSPNGMTATLTYNGVTNSPVAVGDYAVQATLADPIYSGSTTGLFSIIKASAAISFSNLSQTYDATPKFASAQTTPSGLPVILTYNGTTNHPLHAGSYAVTAMVSSASYYATNTATLIINKADQSIDFTQQGRISATKGLNLTATANPSALPVQFAIAQLSPSNENNRAWIENGTQLVFSIEADLVDLAVSASQSGSSNWNAAITRTNHFQAYADFIDVDVASTTVNYDGQPHALTWTCTNTAVTNVILYYNGLAPDSTNPPTDAATYDVTAMIEQPDIYGSGSGILTIQPATQMVSSFNLPATALTTNTLLLSAQTDQGFTNFTFTVLSGPATLSGNQLSFTNAGDAAIRACQPGSENFLPAADTQTITISKTPASDVALTNLLQSYDGTPKAPALLSTPSNLPVFFTYNGSTSTPVEVGAYAVTGSISSPIYFGSATGLFTIAKATATITFSNLTQTYDASPKSPSIQTTPANLPVNLTYNGETNIPVDAGLYLVNATINDAHYTAQTNAVFEITKGTQTMTFDQGGPVDANSELDLAATINSGLPITYTITSFSPSNALNRAWITNSSYVAFSVTNEASELTVRASQDGNQNWKAADSLYCDFDVYPTFNVVEIAPLTVTYDGTPHAPAWTCTNAAVTNVVLYYNGIETHQTNTPIDAGSYEVTGVINQPGIYGSGTNTMTISCATQTVTTYNLPATTFTTNQLTLSAQTDRGLTDFTFAVLNGPALLNGSRLTFTNSGSATITATQSGTSNYLPVTATQTVTISKSAQLPLQFTPTSPMTYATTNLLTTTGGSGEGAVTYEVSTTNLASITNGNYIQILSGTGQITLTATKASDTMYNATATTATVNLAKSPQSITDFLPASGSVFPLNYTVTLQASAQSGGAVSFTNSPSAAIPCWLSSTQFQCCTVGTYLITATQSGDDNWQTATATNSYTIIGSAPVASNQTLRTPINTPCSGQLTIINPDICGTVQYTLLTDPQRGIATVQTNGIFNYTPNNNQRGRDAFTFTVTGNAGSDTGKVTIIIGSSSLSWLNLLLDENN